MIQLRKKTCAGFDGVEHEAYIYKNIDGKKYCKSCTARLEPPKPSFKIHVIRKVSEKQKVKLEEKKVLLEEDKRFYMKCWENKFMYVPVEAGQGYHSEPRCQCCGRALGYEPNLTFFHHILEKRNFPEYRHLTANIAIICSQCHNRYETNPDNVPYLVLLRDKLMEQYPF